MNSFAISRANHESAQGKQLLELGLLSSFARSPEERGFYEAMRQDPGTSLIFADWLEEHGRAGEAFLIRARKTPVGAQLSALSPGRWSAVRRYTEGANGGHRNHFVSWKRETIEVVRLTKQFAVLADGRRVAWNTLSACVALSADFSL